MKLTCITAVFILINLFCQTKKTDFVLQGTVTDASTGRPITGAGISVKERSKHTVTDSAGHFLITVGETSNKLVFSSVGYEGQELLVGRQTKFINIKLRPTASVKLEEVVIGYGTTQDSNGHESEPMISEKLQGLTAGVTINAALNKLKSQVKNAQPDAEEYSAITENRFLMAQNNPVSTFSIDVDGASYSNVRRFLQMGQLPAAGSVRVEELINYFHYNYPQPMTSEPFSINTEISDCPWNDSHKLVMIGLQGRKIPVDHLPSSNLVFLIDVSGSMMEENKLPLVQSSLKLLASQLREQDKVSIVVYAGNAGLVLSATSGAQKQKIYEAIESLQAGGLTAGGAGIELAYKVAKENFIKDANNRVILCTDGDFNVGPSSDADLITIIENERKTGIYLTVLGYGMGNYKDSKMQQLADKGNGNHAYIDNLNEARKVLISEFGGTLFTIAKDVKLQVEFNSSQVQAYRLIGYENRILNKEDFNNDLKDAGDLGSGHTVTALYELIPVGVKNEFAEKTDPLKYQQTQAITQGKGSNELLNIKLRYKKPGSGISSLIEHPVIAESNHSASDNFRFVAAVAEFGMLLSHSEFKQYSNFNDARSLAKGALRNDEEGYRAEFLILINRACELTDRGGASVGFRRPL